MIRVVEDKIEVINVELKSDDVTAACIAWAREAIKTNPAKRGNIDENWTPQLTKDGYGGFVITFRKKADDAARTAA